LHARKPEGTRSAFDFKRPTRTLRFSHQQHHALGNVAPALAAAIDGGTHLAAASVVRQHLDTEDSCAACHRGLRENDGASAAGMPHMADCLVCHPGIEPPFSCDLCHTREARLKPASHTNDYMDAHSRRNANLDKASCRVCHGSAFRCMGCH
jgi:hypothetical protein